MNKLEAFDLASGETKWWVSISSSAMSSPIVAGDTYLCGYLVSIRRVRSDAGWLPDFEILLKKNDKDGNGTISRDEYPHSLNVLSRPETPDVPGATYSIKAAFARFDANKDGELQKEEWEAGLNCDLEPEGRARATSRAAGRQRRRHGDARRVEREDVHPRSADAGRVSEQDLHDQERRHSDLHGCGGGENAHPQSESVLPGPYFSSPICLGQREGHILIS